MARDFGILENTRRRNGFCGPEKRRRTEIRTNLGLAESKRWLAKFVKVNGEAVKLDVL